MIKHTYLSFTHQTRHYTYKLYITYITVRLMIQMMAMTMGSPTSDNNNTNNNVYLIKRPF